VADRQGFEEFVTARSSTLLRTSYLLTRDWALAEDLLQTALARAWLAWERIEGVPEPYVRKIIVNSYASWWRRRWNGEEPHCEVPDARPAGRDPHGQVDDRDALWQALGRLPKRQRAVLVLRYFEDLPEADVAELLGCTVGTVKSQANRAIAKLRLDSSLGPSLDRPGNPAITTHSPADLTQPEGASR
jgi:RNA polymerase sigma-70 factor (sigma-E family)